MFKVERKSENRMDIEISGKLYIDEMKQALDELLEKSEGIENGKMLFDVVDYHLPSLGAIGLEFSRFFPMLGFIKKFSRAAVLADKMWLKKVSEFEGSLIPGLAIKAFSREQRSEAEVWLEKN